MAQNLFKRHNTCQKLIRENITYEKFTYEKVVKSDPPELAHSALLTEKAPLDCIFRMIQF